MIETIQKPVFRVPIVYALLVSASTAYTYSLYYKILKPLKRDQLTSPQTIWEIFRVSPPSTAPFLHHTFIFRYILSFSHAPIVPRLSLRQMLSASFRSVDEEARPICNTTSNFFSCRCCYFLPLFSSLLFVSVVANSLPIRPRRVKLTLVESRDHSAMCITLYIIFLVLRVVSLSSRMFEHANFRASAASSSSFKTIQLQQCRFQYPATINEQIHNVSLMFQRVS